MYNCKGNLGLLLHRRELLLLRLTGHWMVVRPPVVHRLQVPPILLDRRVMGQNVFEVYFGKHSWWNVQEGSSHVMSGEHYTQRQILKLV